MNAEICAVVILLDERCLNHRRPKAAILSGFWGMLLGLF
jgi:hypothetical protein